MDVGAKIGAGAIEGGKEGCSAAELTAGRKIAAEKGRSRWNALRSNHTLMVTSTNMGIGHSWVRIASKAVERSCLERLISM